MDGLNRHLDKSKPIRHMFDWVSEADWQKMNGNDQNKLQDFRYLRRRLDFLRRESYEAAVLVGHLRRGAEKSGLASDNEVGYRIENTERLGEITEIEFVLEYFSRIAYVWSVRAQTVFAAVILFVFLVSLFAVVRMF